MRAPLKTAVSVLFYIDALMWFIGVIPTLYYAFTQGALPTVGGIKLMGGPFESLGLDTLIVAGMIYVVVSALKITAAYWLWRTGKDGAVLGLIPSRISPIFWYGFALPLGPLLGIAQFILLMLVWRALD
jgi:hypothetical protein